MCSTQKSENFRLLSTTLTIMSKIMNKWAPPTLNDSNLKGPILGKIFAIYVQVSSLEGVTC